MGRRRLSSFYLRADGLAMGSIPSASSVCLRWLTSTIFRMWENKAILAGDFNTKDIEKEDSEMRGKKFISLTLSTMLCLQLLPTASFAAGNSPASVNVHCRGEKVLRDAVLFPLGKKSVCCCYSASRLLAYAFSCFVGLSFSALSLQHNDIVHIFGHPLFRVSQTFFVLTDCHGCFVYVILFPNGLGTNLMYRFFGHAAQ